MIKSLNFLLCIIFCQLIHGEAIQKFNDSSKQDKSKSNKIIVYRDRCMATIPIKVEEKNHIIKVPGSIDPQSILFCQNNQENPTYEISKESDKATEAELILYSKNPFISELTYCFTGINWHMHYAAELNESFNEILNFESFISIDNQSGASFDYVDLRLVDGQTDNLAKNQSFSEYCVSIKNTLQKSRVIRVPWVSFNEKSTEQDYRFDVGGECLLNLQGVEKNVPLQIYLSFKQAEELKKDLANGDLTLYVRDNSGTKRFLGINHLKSVKADELIQFAIPLHLVTQLTSNETSPLSQIQGVLEQTEFKTLLTEKLEEAAYRFTIRNFGDKEATIKIMLPFGDNSVKVVRESNEHKQESNKSVCWQVKVASKTEVVVRYRIQLVKE
jgi:hypothetical protein